MFLIFFVSCSEIGCPKEAWEVDHPDWAPNQKMQQYPQPEAAGPATGTENPEIVPPTDATGETQNVPSATDPLVTTENCDSGQLIGEVERNDYSDDDTEETFHDARTDSDFVDSSTQTVRYLRDCGTQVRRAVLVKSVSVQTELAMNDIEQMEQGLSDAKKRVNILEMSQDTYKDDEITRYYTGLPNYKILMIIFGLCEPYIQYTARSVLTKFQQFALTLMKLRLNLYLTDLGYRFGVSRSTASRIFQKCLEVLYCRTKMNVFWPVREVVKSTMPYCFTAAFGDTVTVIIDCFEIVIEKPSNLKAHAQTWSQYKHNHTVKYLIGITPQGFIGFISKPYGGKATDKVITETSGFLDHLCPGDVVMADRGFLIKDSVESCFAKVVMPAFTKGLDQLSPTDVEDTREIANVRIHVERVIGTLRQKYRILTNRVPIGLLHTSNRMSMDEICTVCCALTNFTPSVVPLD